MKSILILVITVFGMNAQAATVAVSCNRGTFQLAKIVNPQGFPHYLYTPVLNDDGIGRYLFGDPDMTALCPERSPQDCLQNLSVWPGDETGGHGPANLPVPGTAFFEGTYGSGSIMVKIFIHESSSEVLLKTYRNTGCYHGGCDYQQLKNWIFRDCVIDWRNVNWG